MLARRRRARCSRALGIQTLGWRLAHAPREREPRAPRRRSRKTRRSSKSARRAGASLSTVHGPVRRGLPAQLRAQLSVCAREKNKAMTRNTARARQVPHCGATLDPTKLRQYNIRYRCGSGTSGGATRGARDERYNSFLLALHSWPLPCTAAAASGCCKPRSLPLQHHVSRAPHRYSLRRNDGIRGTQAVHGALARTGGGPGGRAHAFLPGKARATHACTHARHPF